MNKLFVVFLVTLWSGCQGVPTILQPHDELPSLEAKTDAEAPLVAPLNTAAVVGQAVTLNCKRGSPRILWMFVSATTGTSQPIASDCTVLSIVSNFYTTDSTDGACHLKINALSSSLAGKYSCIDITSNEGDMDAEVIALDTTPQCYTDAKGDYLLPMTTVYMSCSVGYTGRLAPHIVWKNEVGAEIVTESANTTNNHVWSQIKVQAFVPSLRPFTAKTFFNAPPSKEVKDLASNEPSYEYIWTSEAKTVLNARDCWDIKQAFPSSTTGIYDILVTGTPVSVRCDMTTEGGGWTMLQRRYDGSTNFYRNWTDYANGFGYVNSEFWIGNEVIHQLIIVRVNCLRVDLQDWTGAWRYQQYSNLVVGDRSTNYYLKQLGICSGTAGDSLEYHVGMQFSTHDKDNDVCTCNCAEDLMGAWWHRDCRQSSLNGLYTNQTNNRGIIWYTWGGVFNSLKTSEMKIRPSC